MAAESPQAVAERLQAAGLFPVAIEPLGMFGWSGRSWRARFGASRRVGAAALAAFARRLADLLRSGLPLAPALDLLARQERNAELRRAVESVRDEVRGGSALSAAAAKSPGTFPPIFVSLIKAGEISGGLDVVVERLALYFERAGEIQGRVRAALVYPAVLLLLGTGAVAFLLIVVIPKFAALFAELGQALPWPTRLLLALSVVFSKGWWVILAAACGAAAGLDRWRHRPAGRLKMDAWALRLPVLGPLLQAEYGGRFARTLGTLLQSGVPILRGLDLAGSAVPNVLIRRELEQIGRAVEDGAGLAKPLRASTVFPPVLGELATVGEESGSLETVLLRGAEGLEREVERGIRTLLSLLEPAIVIALGGAVAFIVLAVMLPVSQVAVVLR